MGVHRSVSVSSGFVLVPLEKLFFESFVIRVGVSTIVLCLPVFFAGIVFVSSFAKARFGGSALGSNLFGSLAGDLLECLSLWFGLKSLIILAAVIYGGSAIALIWRTRTPGLRATEMA